MLEVDGLFVAYGGVRAVDDLSLRVERGEFVALLGANGAGKSSTLKAIVGAVAPRSGRVMLEGRAIAGRGPHELVAEGLALVPEGGRVFARQNVEHNLMLGAHLERRSDLIARRLERVYALFPRLAERRTQLAGTLSGGERQMCAIGRALMSAPRVLLLDEPSLGLSPLLIGVVFGALAALNRAGVSILLVEQNMRQALRVATRAYVMQTGRVAMEGRAEDLKASREVRRAYLGI